MVSVESQVDHLLNGSKPQCVISHHSKNRSSGLSGFFRQFIYGALIGMLVVTITLIPVFGGRNGLGIVQEFLESNGSEDVVSIGDPPSNESAAYHYWYAPENSFGISETKEVNWSYFRELFLAHTDWMLEYKRYESSEWTDGLDYLTIERTWNDTGFWKFNLILDVPVHVYSARFTFGCDRSVLQYVEREGYEVWINYSANETETYSVMFNWSDIAGIPGLVITKGVQNNMFWLRFRRDDIPAGHYEFDPWFGYNVATGSADFDCDNRVRANTGDNMKPASSGTLDNITARIRTTDGGSGTFSAGIWYYGNGTFIACSDNEVIVSSSTHAWRVFTFTGVNLVANQRYACGVWSSDVQAVIRGLTPAADGRIWRDDRTYAYPFSHNFDIGGNSSNYWMQLYASYTVAAGNNAPTLSGESPVNASTGISVTPSLYVICTDSDAGDTMNATWRSNSSGSWVDFATNLSISTGTNITQDNSNFSTGNTIYRWSVNLTDGTDWVNETYHFTTAANETWQTIDSAINGSYSNATTWRAIDQTINGSYVNVTTWNTIDATVNGSYINITSWAVIDQTINGSYSNTTGIAWQTIDSTINGSYVNTTAWKLVDNTVNGSYSNTTAFYIIDITINGSYINITLWRVIDNTINGSYINASAITWQVIDSTVNGSYFNDTTTWQNIDATINGSYYNTSIPWVIIDITINGSYYNTSVVTLSLTNEYPVNGSNIFSVQPTLYFTLSSPVGGMSYSIYIGNTNTTANFLLDSDSGLDNGTFHYVNFYNASGFSTTYWWRVHYNDSSSHVNETFSFTPVQPGGGGMMNNSVMGVIGLIGIFGLLGFIMHRRRRERNE